MELVALILFVLSSSGTPGPNNVMILTSGVNHGLKRSIPHILGVNIGFPLMVVCVGIGIVNLFKLFPLLYQILQIVGVGYLLYLAYKIATMPVNMSGKNSAKPFTFLQAAGFQWVNPKAWVMAINVLVIFSAPNISVTEQISTIALFYFVFGLPCSLAWLCVGVSLQDLLAKPDYVKIFNVVMALVLVWSLLPTIQSIINNQLTIITP